MRVHCSIPILVALMTAAGLAGSAHAADVRAKAEVACKPLEKKLHYDCTIKLVSARTGEPLIGVTVTMGADMPSMPMAHNVRPVKAEPVGEAGVYRAVIELEMYGDWAIRLDLSGPFRDRLIVVKRFDNDASHGTAQKTPHGGH